jgi:hypothetical protein
MISSGTLAMLTALLLCLAHVQVHICVCSHTHTHTHTQILPSELFSIYHSLIILACNGV